MSTVYLGLCTELKIINIHHIHKNPMEFSYLRHFLGTLSNTNHDTPKSAMAECHSHSSEKTGSSQWYPLYCSWAKRNAPEAAS